MDQASAGSTVNGFSARTWMPASSAARACSARRATGPVRVTMSGLAAMTSRQSVVAWANPNFACSSARRPDRAG